jgi:hypothetical protein
MTASRWTAVAAALVIALVATPRAGSAEQTGTTGSDAARATRQRFLEMFARSYFPGRTGQLLVVPRKGDFITRPDPYYAQMHGTPWPYDVDIPLMFTGPAVKTGPYSLAAVQQDIAPTLAAALGVKMPPTATGHVLPVLRKGFARPRAIMLLVLDGMRRDYFDQYAASMPTLTALRHRGAWFTQAQVNVLPSNTAVGHSTIATGAGPGVHGITGVSTYDWQGTGATRCLPGVIRKICWRRRSQTYGSVRPPGARSSWRREVSTGRRRRLRDMVRVNRMERRSCWRATTNSRASGTRTPPASGCPTI